MVRQDVEILKWFAGAQGQIQPQQDLDLPFLIRGIRAHRLAGHALRRISIERPEWVGQELLDILRAFHRQAVSRVKQQAASLRSLEGKIGALDDLIVIKGFTTYALSSDDFDIRFSTDIDVVSRDESLLVASVKDDASATGSPLAPHELATVDCGDAVFDIHRYAPVWLYPDQMLETHFARAYNENIWVQSHDIFQTEVGFLEVSDHCTTSTASLTKGIQIPNANMAILISCAHLLRNYAEFKKHSIAERFPVVRLAEIADLNRLRVHESFNKEEFLKLAEKYSGQHCISFASFLIETYLGQEALPCNTSIGTGLENYARRLWFGIWVQLREDANRLLGARTNMQRICADLQASIVMNSRQEDEYLYSTEVTTQDLRVETVLANCSDSFILPVKFSFMVTEEGVRLNLKVLDTVFSVADAIRLDFGRLYCEWIYEVENKTWSRRGDAGQANINFGDTLVASFTAENYCVQLFVPWAMLRMADVELISPLPLIIGAARYSLNKKVVAATVVPLNLQI